MSSLRVGLLAYPVTAPASFEAFAEKFDGLVAAGKAGGGDLLVMPEYASMETAAFDAGAGSASAELVAVCGLAPRLLELFCATARKHSVWLLPGSMPWRDAAGGVRNRAPLVDPEGGPEFQDKSVMTRFETEQWGVGAGHKPRVFDTPWGRIGVAICYDVEFPPVVRRQVEDGAWLILAPSCTDTVHGFNRVRLSARARAIENQCFVAVAPTVGFAPALATLDENHGYAAVFGPVDRGFPPDGVMARGAMDQPGWVFANLDPATIDAVRQDGAVRNHRDWKNLPA